MPKIIYPFINYPYLDENVPALRRLVDSAHRAHKRLKLYYTTRELTKNLPEFWAFNSLERRDHLSRAGERLYDHHQSERTGRVAEEEPQGELHPRLAELDQGRAFPG